MKRSKAIQLGQPIMAKYVGSTVAGLAPRIMGIGPSIAIPKLLATHNVSLADMDVIEINEAFASMAVYCRDKLNLDWAKMNPRGGAIALGHPLDKYSGIQDRSSALIRCGLFTVYRCPSACDRVQRVASTTGQGGHVCNNNLDRCSKTDVFIHMQQILVTSMCIGTGMGAAGVFVRET